ncbi:MAG TPA: hypothetical protein VK753_01140 [Xanthomonadaceae bacterium]|nr:hypothetical protein [Xanthomonadaceae bacterium]
MRGIALASIVSHTAWGSHALSLAVVLALALLATTPASASSMGAAAGSPLRVDVHSHVVVMEYEAWFGPNAVTFQDAEAMPVLQSADMQGVGGGYDSADPQVIRQHVAWMQYMGVDAALVDLSNNVGCIFSQGPASTKFCDPADAGFRQSNRIIRDNTGNLYPAWSALGTPLKLIPLLGCLDERDLATGDDGKSGLQKETEYFGHLMATYPGLDVDYLGHPLMLLYIGTPVDTALLARARVVLHKSGLDARYTIRIVAGYLDSQPEFWLDPNQQPTRSIQIAPLDDLWSWVDRLSLANGLYPTYNAVADTVPARAENFTAAIATAGENGWGCPEPTYCSDDALRFRGPFYATLDDFMGIATRLDPIFLIVHQFNEFNRGDEGWNADTSDDIEPTREPGGWGYGGLRAVHDRIERYRIFTRFPRREQPSE